MQTDYHATTTKRTRIEIQGLNINVNTPNTTVYLPVCTFTLDKQEGTAEDAHLQELKAYIIHGRPDKRNNVVQDVQKYWPNRLELAMSDGVAIKGKQIIIPSQLMMQILESAAQQPHGN